MITVTGCWVQVFSLILDSSVGLSASIQYGDLVSETLGFEEDNLSPFDSNIGSLCQSIEINYSKHVYRQSQVQKPTGSGIEWAVCSVIIGTVCWVQILAWSSMTQTVCEWAFSLLTNWCLRLPSFESCIQQRKTTCLLTIRKPVVCARTSKLTTANMYVCICDNVNNQEFTRKWVKETSNAPPVF